MRPVHNTLISWCLVALVGVLVLTGWNDTGPRWTKAKARTTLLSTPRIIATDGSYTYIFEPVQIIRLRPHGHKAAVGWRRFEVLLDFDPLRGDFPSGHFATFCVHVQRRGFAITGFDTIITSINWQDIGYGLGCKDTPSTRKRTGRPYP